MLNEDKLIRKSSFPLEHRLGLSLVEIVDGIGSLLLAPFGYYANFACRYSRFAIQDIINRYSYNRVRKMQQTAWAETQKELSRQRR